MIYSGNADLICHHTGNARMIDNLNWSGASAWANAQDQPIFGQEVLGTVGYLKRFGIELSELSSANGLIGCFIFFSELTTCTL
jgi:carboxypeptidase C (cathepsin A)